jgi:hypothetical protein
MAEDGGSADAAEATKLPRRGLVLGDQVGAMSKAKLFSLDGCVGRKCAPLGTAAHRAMAVCDDAEGTVRAKPNPAAQARARNRFFPFTGAHTAMMPHSLFAFEPDANLPRFVPRLDVHDARSTADRAVFGVCLASAAAAIDGYLLGLTAERASDPHSASAASMRATALIIWRCSPSTPRPRRAGVHRVLRRRPPRRAAGSTSRRSGEHIS